MSDADKADDNGVDDDEARSRVTANLSINPDPKYFVPRPDEPFNRIRSFIETSSGGVIGLTGVRGAGKSMLLNKIVEDFEAEKYFTLHITAPTTSSDETAFLDESSVDDFDRPAEQFGSLIDIYAVLPYNSDICERYLRKIDPIDKAEAAE